ADATEIFEEGLRIPPLRLTDEVRQILFANSRTPIERQGDLDAQVGANALGVARLGELATGSGGLALDEVVDYGERRMRAALAGLPDGSWTVEDVLDSTGAGEAYQRPCRIVVTVTVAGESM